jgi:hypothetical protein
MLGQKAHKLAVYIAFVLLTAWLLWQSSQILQPSTQYRGATTQEQGTSRYTEEEKKKTDEALARYTGWLTFFTGILALATIGLGIATLKQITLARIEFISSHRPKLRLKHIWVSSPDGQTFVGELQAGVPLTVRLDIVNIGSTPATINIINFVTLIIPSQGRLPQRPPYNEPGFLHQFQIGSFRLESGITFTHHVSDGRILAREDIRALRDGDNRLYFVGAIGYRDDAQRPRGTAFCRHFSFYSYPAHPNDIGRFQTENDPDYEYQD